MEEDQSSVFSRIIVVLAVRHQCLVIRKPLLLKELDYRFDTAVDSEDRVAIQIVILHVDSLAAERKQNRQFAILAAFQ